MNLINLTTEIFEVDHLRVKSRRKLQSTEGTPQISRRSFFPVLLKTTDSCLRNGYSVSQTKIHWVLRFSGKSISSSYLIALCPRIL